MSLWRRRNRELDEEIEAHLAMAARDRIERGEDPREAALAARREFGSRVLIEETTREMWGWTLLESLWQDVHYALRGLRRSPGFTAVAILTLALGIGANTAIFSLVDTMLLRLLPVADPEQLVGLSQKYPGEPWGNGYWSWRSYEHFRDHNHVFSALTGAQTDNHARIEAAASQPGFGFAEYVLGDYFAVLGVEPARGRWIVPGDRAAVVVSWSCWQNRYHGDPAILGRRIVVNDVPATIIGVAPREFMGLRIGIATEVWLPLEKSEHVRMGLVARLRPGVTLPQARAEVAVLYRFTIDERRAQSIDPLLRELKSGVEPVAAGFSNGLYDKPLLVLMALVGLLLLIVCINIAGLLLARGAGRQREMAVRIGLGAGRGRLVRQALTESLLLATLGTTAGLAVAYFATNTLVRILASGREHERIQLNVQPDWRLLLFAAGIAFLTGVLFGLAPALSAWRSAPALRLRETGRAGDTRRRRLFGKTLVAAQVALSLLLLSAAGLFIAHLSSLRNTGLGFRRDHVLLLILDTSHAGFKSEQLAECSRELLTRLESIPGVRSATLSGATPIQGAGASRFITAEGYVERPEDRRYTALNWVGPRSFETLGIPLLAGREFAFEDQNRPHVAIVNDALAHRYFRNRDPIGKHITIPDDPKPFEIVGVVGDAKYMEIHDPPPPTMYLNALQVGETFSQYAVRTSVDPARVAAEVRRAAQDVLRTAPVEKVTTLSDQVDAAVVPERLIATLSGFFGVLGAAIAGIGLYGLLAYTVARRTNEIGVRMAMGATSGGIARMVLADALMTVILGLLVGTPLAISGRRVAAALLPDLTIDAAPFLPAASAILLVAILASYVPARRAARIDPMDALRNE